MSYPPLSRGNAVDTPYDKDGKRAKKESGRKESGDRERRGVKEEGLEKRHHSSQKTDKNATGTLPRKGSMPAPNKQQAAENWELNRLNRTQTPYGGTSATTTPPATKRSDKAPPPTQKPAAPAPAGNPKDRTQPVLKPVGSDIMKKTEKDFKLEKSYPTIGFYIWKTPGGDKDPYREKRLFAFGSPGGKMEFGGDDLRKHKILIYKAPQDDVVVLVNRNDDKDRRVVSPPEGWRASVIFNKDQYRVARLKHTDMRVVQTNLLDMDKIVEEKDYVKLD